MKKHKADFLRLLRTVGADRVSFGLAIYIAGYFALSPLWILLVTALAVHHKYREQRFQTWIDAIQFERDMHSSSALRKAMGRLPPWVDFSKVEQAPWLQNLLKTLWPQAKCATEDSIRSGLASTFENYKMAGITTLGFSVLDMGKTPPLVEGARVVPYADGIKLDIHVVMNTKNNIIIAAGHGRVVCNVKVKDLVLRMTLRLLFKPLYGEMPCFKAVCVSLGTTPDVSFKLEALGPLSKFPGLDKYLDNLLRSQLASGYVWPKRMPFPMVDLSPEEEQNLVLEQPDGVLEVYLVKGVKLHNVERMGTSDPFCIMTVGGEQQQSTVKDNSLSPVWKEKFNFLVYDKEEVLRIEVKDENRTGDGEMGQTEVRLSELPAGTEQMRQLVLSNVPTGHLELRLMWKPLAKVGMTEHGSLQGAVCNVTIHSCHNLKNVDRIGKSDPYVKVWLQSDAQFKTPVVANNLNPVFEAPFSFQLTGEKAEALQFQVKDSNKLGANLVMGELRLPIADIMSKGGTIVKQDYKWAHGGDATINLSVSIHLSQTADSAGLAEQSLAELRLARLEAEKTRRNSMTPAAAAAIEELAPVIVAGPARLHVTLHKAVGLPVMDKGTSDPYVTFSVDNWKSKQKSSIKKRCVSTAEWNESLVLKMAECKDSVLRLKLKEWDALRKDRTVDELAIPIAGIAAKALQRSQLNLKTGSLVVSAWLEQLPK